MEETMSAAMPDAFDRLLGQLHGLPDVTNTKPSTLRTLTPLLGTSQMYIVQTYRQQVGKEDGETTRARDTIFLECVSKDGSVRLAIPPPVADAIARQRESLTGKVRSKTGKRIAEERKARGEVPGFMRGKK
jgi:hypothetical protein